MMRGQADTVCNLASVAIADTFSTLLEARELRSIVSAQEQTAAISHALSLTSLAERAAQDAYMAAEEAMSAAERARDAIHQIEDW